MLGLWDSKTVGGTSNKIFPLVIIDIVGQFNVSQILINDSSSCNIMYSKLFEKMGLERGSLWSYGPPLRGGMLS